MNRLKADLPKIEIDLSYGGIEAGEIKAEGPATSQPVDVIAVGHYRGVRSSGAERDLDLQISKCFLGPRWKPGEGGILTQFSDHSVLPGDLGQVFYLPDPRDPNHQRLIAIAGMGPPGRFGVPELTLLVQQLCWTLGVLGKHHLATTLIGAGTGNLSLSDAIYAWTRGIRAAITGRDSTLETITFVNINPAKIIDIDYALRHEQTHLKSAERGLNILYSAIDETRQNELATESVDLERKKLKRQLARRLEQIRNPSLRDNQDLDNVSATRLTIEFNEEEGYQFGVISEDAAIPIRATLISPGLVLRANRELEEAKTFSDQLDRGRFLSELLLPNDLASALTTNAPIVMALDTNAAQIHWEMLAPDPIGAVATDETDVGNAEKESEEEDLMRFLGTPRGFTRQLRTMTSPLDLPPPVQRTLHVLVIGDPAEDARLPDAEVEATQVAKLFQAYDGAPHKNSDPDNQVEVKLLCGPGEATRTNVLRELMIKRYDILHFAGHGQFNRKDPTKSGWLFRNSPEEYISATELRRIDRIPKFIFSNACESGVMPDRLSPIYSGLGPTFAESFFNQGVTNFICTAWKVDDSAAKVFAREFYASLLGLELDADRENVVSRGKPEPIVTALRRARRATATSPGGAQIWGAYQHYGNPFYSFFARSAWSDQDN